jgi:hypothetical protein
VPLTRDGDLCDADELLCWLVDGGLLLLASGKRVASLTKNLYGAIFLLFYCYQIREDDFVFRCPFCPPYWLELIRADLVQYYFSLVTN